jgi:hypothetical protein
MEVMMRNAKWIVATLGLVTLTAGCVQQGGYYPNTANNGYYQNTAYNSSRSSNYWNSARRDADRDGVPNRYDRDANGDGVADRYQGRTRY